ncbi:MAG: gamma-glutamyl-gamma-aminobutyrate hydrolase family protein [Bacilli bacterium]|nr:gamma-glutamyl-gamma-aminobutyrate hydrolase family protein [Bacilli bacterium]
MSKPIIGIVGRSDISREEYNTICCFESVRRSIIKKGGIPILILPNQDLEYEISRPKDIDRLTLEEKNDLRKVIDICDGIVMPGTYKLFEYDRFIYEYALNKDIPILGLCGGMQLMGLVDNDDVDSKDILIKNNTDILHFQKGIKYVHKINIIENTLLSKILNKKELNINSRHNFHLDKVKKLKVCAYSEDGIIEAVELSDKKFVLGVQWHPESMLDFDENANKIFETFISSCKV